VRLETIEAAIRALHEGAVALVGAREQEGRATALEGERDVVDEQLDTASKL
jgi:hypothetical protein